MPTNRVIRTKIRTFSGSIADGVTLMNVAPDETLQRARGFAALFGAAPCIEVRGRACDEGGALVMGGGGFATAHLLPGSAYTEIELPTQDGTPGHRIVAVRPVTEDGQPSGIWEEVRLSVPEDPRV